MSTLDRAIAIAAAAHAGQVNKAGEPYILHPLRVMLSLASESERVVGVLHDVVEKSPWTLSALKSEGFTETIIGAIDSVTRRQDEEYDDFVRRSAANEIGRAVKFADLRDNMHLVGIKAPSPDDNKQMEKYRRAERILAAWPLSPG